MQKLIEVLDNLFGGFDEASATTSLPGSWIASLDDGEHNHRILANPEVHRL